ncbi:MAG TPA: hypothetical protein VG838_13740 [Opitutaceae bacterium]|nr:hypothetical protein [Opitutaceae bacterium]
MATKKKALTAHVDEQIIDNLSRVAAAAHLDTTKFAALVLSRFSELKIEHGLDALTSIPKDLFKGRPGRPPAAASSAETSAAAATQN